MARRRTDPDAAAAAAPAGAEPSPLVSPAPRRRGCGAQEQSPPLAREQSPPPTRSPAHKKVKLHRFANPLKYDAQGCPIYTRAECWADALVHVVGVPFGYGGSYLMLRAASDRLPEGPWSDADRRVMLGLWAYAFGLCAMLTASASYNIVGCSFKVALKTLRRIDHACIYLMIAGCYTPPLLALQFDVISDRFSNESALVAIWVIALLGAAAKVILARRFETPGLVLYVALGCVVVAFTHAVTEGFLGGQDLLWEFQKSGACYLFGLVFYLDDDIPFSNALWHACVLAGAVSHWVILYRLIACGDDRYPRPPL